MDAVAETFIDEIETLLNRDLPEEERIPLIEKFRKMYETMDFYVLYNRFLKKEGYQTLPRRPLEKRKLRYEDVYPVLYLKYRLSRQAERSNIKHLVIDEMQDYSRLQYLIIRRMFSCKMTILGDRAQTMADQQQDVLQFLPGIFGKDLRRIEMRKSYRNTVEISDFANESCGTGILQFIRWSRCCGMERRCKRKRLRMRLRFWQLECRRSKRGRSRDMRQLPLYAG